MRAQNLSIVLWAASLNLRFFASIGACQTSVYAVSAIFVRAHPRWPSLLPRRV